MSTYKALQKYSYCMNTYMLWICNSKHLQHLLFGIHVTSLENNVMRMEKESLAFIFMFLPMQF